MIERTRWSELGPHDPDSGLVNVVVETPAGSRNKYRFDEALGVFRLHKLLPVGSAFPFDFGFVPATRADDGDAVDVLLLGDEPTFTGCLVTVRPLGILEAEERDKGRTIRNDRIVAVPQTAKIRPEARSLDDLPAWLLAQIEHFFVAYNRAEGREFVVIARQGPDPAARSIDEGARRYRSIAG